MDTLVTVAWSCEGKALDCVRDPKMSEVPELWDVCQGGLRTGNEASIEEGVSCMQQSWKVRNF